jgi:competence protein ComEA
VKNPSFLLILTKDGDYMGKKQRILFYICIAVIVFSITMATLIVHQSKLNINTATKQELMIIPELRGNGILAQRIIEYREKYGKFHRTEELLNIDGIGEKRYRIIIKYVRCD